MTDTEALASCREVMAHMDKIIDALRTRIKNLEFSLNLVMELLEEDAD